MIEKYFQKGNRIKWMAPKDNAATDQWGGYTADGSVIDNPLMITNPIIYDGLDGELISHSPHNVTTSGIKKGQTVPYKWLAYSVGSTTNAPLVQDTLTGFMSGCLIATWKETGVRHVGHVGTCGDAKVNNLVRGAFLQYAPQETKGFNPAAEWSPGEIAPLQMKFKHGANAKILALVTAHGNMYSILMFKLSKPLGAPGTGDLFNWCVGGIKPATPLNYAAIKAMLSKVAA